MSMRRTQWRYSGFIADTSSDDFSWPEPTPELDLEEGQRPPIPATIDELSEQDRHRRGRGRPIMACPYCGPSSYLDETGSCSVCHKRVPTV